LKK
jgi:hypothetical protein